MVHFFFLTSNKKKSLFKEGIFSGQLILLLLLTNTMSSNQSFSYDNLSQQTSDIRNWGLNDASQEDLIASFTRDNDINAKLDLILSKMVALETKMDKLESSVQQGVQNYYDEMHSSHIVSSLINGKIYPINYIFFK